MVVKSVTGRESCFLEKTDYDLLTKGLMMTNPLPYRSEDIDPHASVFLRQRRGLLRGLGENCGVTPMLLFALLRLSPRP